MPRTRVPKLKVVANILQSRSYETGEITLKIGLCQYLMKRRQSVGAYFYRATLYRVAKKNRNMHALGRVDGSWNNRTVSESIIVDHSSEWW